MKRIKCCEVKSESKRGPTLQINTWFRSFAMIFNEYAVFTLSLKCAITITTTLLLEHHDVMVHCSQLTNLIPMRLCRKAHKSKRLEKRTVSETTAN